MLAVVATCQQVLWKIFSFEDETWDHVVHSILLPVQALFNSIQVVLLTFPNMTLKISGTVLRSIPFGQELRPSLLLARYCCNVSH